MACTTAQMNFGEVIISTTLQGKVSKEEAKTKLISAVRIALNRDRDWKSVNPTHTRVITHNNNILTNELISIPEIPFLTPTSSMAGGFHDAALVGHTMAGSIS